MGTQVDRLPVQGIAIPSRLVSPDTLRPLDADTPASVFQQAEPAAGAAAPVDADSRLQLDLTGGQEAEIEITVVQGGLPGVDGLGVAYRFASETTTDTDDELWRGLGEPVAFTDAVGCVEDSSDDFEYHDLVTTVGSHDLLFVWSDEMNGGPVYSKRWSRSTAEWGSAVVVSAQEIGPGTEYDDLTSVCAIALPDGAVVVVGVDATILRTWRSEDFGATWSELSHRAGHVGGSPHFRGCYFRGDLLLIGTSGTSLAQLVSADLGATFRQVYEAFGVVDNETTTRVRAACAAAPWGVVIAYARATDGHVYVRTLAAAGQPFDTADAVEVVAEQANSVAVVVAESGAINVIAAIADRIRVFQSRDRGATWTDMGALLRLGIGGTALYYPTTLAATLYRGQLVVAHQNYSDPLGSPAMLGPVAAVFSSGWSNLVPALSFTEEVDFLAPVPLAWLSSQYPIGTPAGMGWTAIGATAVTVVAGRIAQWSVTASDGAFSVAAGSNPVAFQGTTRIDSGTPSVATLTHGVALQKADGVNERIVEVRIGATSIVAYDRNAAATLGTLTIDCTKWVQVFAEIDDNNRANVFARLAGSSAWTRICGPSTLTNNTATPAANGLIAWGVINATTAVVQWRAVARDVATVYRVGLTTQTFAAPMESGGLLSARGAALPDVGSTTRAALLSARRGPGRRSERVTISPVHTYGVDNFFPRLGESPDRVWRSTDKTACSFVFDLGEYDGKLGPDWIRILGLFRTNFRKAFLESSSDGSSWTLRDTWDAATGFVDLDYELQGQTIRPTSGTASGARPLHRNELAGGYAIFDNTTALEIRGNSAGVWASPTGTTKWAEIEVIGDVSGLGATGEVVLVFPNAVSFGRFSGVQPTLVDRFWRVRIASAEITPWSYLQIGKLFLGDAVVFGKRSSRGWQREVRPNARRSISRYGTIRKRQDGPPAGRWTLGWADGEQQARHRAGLTDVDYVRAGSTGPALAMRDDVYANVVALLEETRSGEVPVLALASIPDEATTVNDRSLFLYGSLEGGASFGQVEGREGYDAFGRVDPITIDEIR